VCPWAKAPKGDRVKVLGKSGKTEGPVPLLYFQARPQPFQYPGAKKILGSEAEGEALAIEGSCETSGGNLGWTSVGTQIKSLKKGEKSSAKTKTKQNGNQTAKQHDWRGGA